MAFKTFQQFILDLCTYWTNQGCILSQPYDANMGAGTFHPHTFLRGIGPEPWKSVYVQPCRRPVDGRYGKSPYRWQHYYQLQVLLKPAPENILDIFLKSLEHVGIHLKEHDICLLEDDWKGPTLGAWGLGWEVRANGQEVTQFTYFQQLGGLDVDVVCGEITYGLERLYMYAYGVKNGFDIPYNENFTYGDIFQQNEFEFSHFNFNEANTAELFATFDRCELRVEELCKKGFILPAYDYVLQASHTFNLLDARGAISASERQRYIGRVRDCAKMCAAQYRLEREKLGFPMLARQSDTAKEQSQEKNIYQNIEQFSPQKSLNIAFEVGVEEMPPSFQTSALQELEEKKEKFLASLKENFSLVPQFIEELEKINFSFHISARRIGCVVSHSPLKEPRQNLEVWGPAERIARTAEGELSAAGLGFCRKNNIAKESVQFKAKSDGSGVFLYFDAQKEGRDFPTLMAQEFKNWIEELSANLKMKWHESSGQLFIRPVRWVLALVEDKVIPLSLFGLSSGRLTCGHRILHPEFIAIESATHYLETLRKINVEPNPRLREQEISLKANALATSIQGEVFWDAGLLKKCVGLSENPQVFLGKFDEKYLRLPATLITAVLKEHMNYFSVVKKGTAELLPYYIGVANYQCLKMDEMIEGTKGVVEGRLDDGVFYFDTDLARPLSFYNEGLKNLVFQAGMGTLWDKSQRIKSLLLKLQNILSNSSFAAEKYKGNLKSSLLEAAGEYAKSDLKTGCVQEFPDEMQGIMGGILVAHQNILNNEADSKIVGNAIAEHYLPQGAHSPLPAQQLGVLLSLADKLDSLCLMINSGVDVKGNKDPMGLRRLSIAIVRLIGGKGEENTLPFVLKNIIKGTFEVFKNCHIPVSLENEEKAYAFILDRVKHAWRDEFNASCVEATASKAESLPLSSLREFTKSLENSLLPESTFQIAKALVPYRRARNLTLSLKEENIASIDTALFQNEAENNLFQYIQESEGKVANYFYQQNFTALLQELSNLTLPLENFFNNVMVNDQNSALKENRLALLWRVRKLFESVAEFSCIQA